MKPFIRILIVLGCVLQGLFIKTEHEEKHLTADILKGAAALMFVLIGLSAEGSGPGDHLFVAGLIFGMIGDILLNLRYVFPKQGQKIFLGGIVAFLIGHLLYLAGLIPQASSPWLWPMEVKKSFKIFGVFYLGAVFIMTAIAIGIAIFSPSKRAIVYCVGAFLFTVSDVVLIFNTFSGVTKFSMRIANLSLYYAGQILIACSLFL